MCRSACRFCLFGVLFTAASAKSESDRDKPMPGDAVSAEQRQAAFQALKAKCGVDLAAHGPEQQKALSEAISTLLPRRPKDHFGSEFRPRLFTNLRQDPLYLLVEVRPAVIHPGTTGIRLTLLDSEGEAITESTFGTGHRCYLHGLEMMPAPDMSSQLLVLTVTPGWMGPKQYYGLAGGRFDLVRLEDPDGRAKRNHYSAIHYPCGPAVLRQTSSEWEADLLSGDYLRTLRALVWLGGGHRRLEEPGQDAQCYQPAEEALLVKEVRARKKVVARLKALARSEDQWLREGALLALHPSLKNWDEIDAAARTSLTARVLALSLGCALVIWFGWGRRPRHATDS